MNTTLALVGGAFGALLGAFALAPAASARPRWVRAATRAELSPGRPVTRVLAVPRSDGWYRARARLVVFLIADGAGGVKALSATCTHLGCQVRWRPDEGQFHCPCHGGVYAVDGSVVSGPPPRPLDPVDVQVGADDTVLVRV